MNSGGANGQELSFQIDEIGTAWVESIDRGVAERLRDALAAGAREVTLTFTGDDTEGHAWDRGIASVAVRLADEDDVEGHAIAIRFPSPQDARRFQARMLATGALVATIAVGGVGIATQGSFGTGAEGTVQQAPITQAAAPGDLAGSTSASQQYQDAYAGGDASPSGLAGSTTAGEQYQNTYAGGDGSASDADESEDVAGSRTPGHQPR